MTFTIKLDINYCKFFYYFSCELWLNVTIKFALIGGIKEERVVVAGIPVRIGLIYFAIVNAAEIRSGGETSPGR